VIMCGCGTGLADCGVGLGPRGMKVEIDQSRRPALAVICAGSGFRVPEL
jgi:hypothetical protein